MAGFWLGCIVGAVVALSVGFLALSVVMDGWFAWPGW